MTRPTILLGKGMQMSRGVEGDLAVLEAGLRQLEFEYDQFLSGNVRTLPLKTEKSVQALIRNYSGRAIQNSSLRFRYTNLVARYNALKRVWDRKVREREEGRLIGRPLKSSLPAPPPVKAAGRREFVASNLRSEKESMEEIFEAYKGLRERCGESTQRLRLENFTNILADRVEKLKQSKGCTKVEIRLREENGKCRIMVRPSKA